MANQHSSDLITVAGINTSILKYQQAVVATTKQLAAFYGCEEVNLRKNFNTNKDRFEEGKHYFRLTGKQVSDFAGLLPKDTTEIPEATNILVLWTEKGAARHAKMLSTDRAWEVFEALEDTYFKVRDEMAIAAIGDIQQSVRAQIGGIMKSVVHKEIQDAISSILPALVHGELAKHQMSVRRGHTAGQVWNAHGLPKVKGAAVMLSNRLETFGCMIDGDGRAEMGGRTAKLFDPDKASKAMKSGLLDFCQKYVKNRNGQHSLFPLKSV